MFKAACLFLSLHCPAWAGFVELYAVSRQRWSLPCLGCVSQQLIRMMIKCETGREAGAPSGCWSLDSRSFTPNQSWPGPQGLLGLSREGLTHTDSFMRRCEVLSQVGVSNSSTCCPAARAANSHRNSHAFLWSVFTFTFRLECCYVASIMQYNKKINYYLCTEFRLDLTEKMTLEVWKCILTGYIFINESHLSIYLSIYLSVCLS